LEDEAMNVESRLCTWMVMVAGLSLAAGCARGPGAPSPVAGAPGCRAVWVSSPSDDLDLVGAVIVDAEATSSNVLARACELGASTVDATPIRRLPGGRTMFALYRPASALAPDAPAGHVGVSSNEAPVELDTVFFASR
jgi:hypothetical protein